VFAGAGHGQDAGEKKTAEGLRNQQAQPPVVGLGAGERIRKHYVAMAMKTPKAVLLKQIERDLEVAKGWSDPAREDGKFGWEKTKISTIDRRIYNMLRQIITSGVIGSPTDAGGDVAIRRVDDADQGPITYEINVVKLVKRGDRLAKLKIRYEQGGKEVTKEYDVATDNTGAIGFESFGVYTITLDPTIVPKAYTATVLRRETKKSEPLPEQIWPEERERYCVIELVNFEGNLPALFNVMTDGNKVASPYYDIKEAQTSTLVVGTMFPESIIESEFNFDRNQYIMRFSTPPGYNIDRVKCVWVYFPVQTTEVAGVLKKYREMTDFDLLDGLVTKGEGVRAGPEETGLKPNDGSKWYEIPRVGDRFERVFRIEDINGWRQQKDLRISRLVAYQFQPQEGKQNLQLIRVRPPGSEEKIGNFVNAREVPEWPTGIRRLAEMQGENKKGR
jgi:hypothetical protein